MRRAFFALLVLSLAPIASAFADPVFLTSGTIAVAGPYSTDYGWGDFDFSGNEFTAAGGGAGVAPHLSAFGSVVDLSGTVGVGANGRGYVVNGAGTLRGYASATFQVTAIPAMVVSDLDGRGASVQTPFTARGLVQLFASLGDAQPIFSQEVVGAGKIGISGIKVGDGQYLTSFVGLDFSRPDPGAPTPEPASLLLLGTGVAAAWQSRRLRRIA